MYKIAFKWKNVRLQSQGWLGWGFFCQKLKNVSSRHLCIIYILFIYYMLFKKIP